MNVYAVAYLAGVTFLGITAPGFFYTLYQNQMNQEEEI